MTRTRIRTAVCALLGSGLLLTACSSSPGAADAASGTSGATPSGHSAPPASAPVAGRVTVLPTDPAASGPVCTVHLYGHATRAEVSGAAGADPSALCGRLATSLSGGGDFWTTQADAARGPVPAVCGVTKDGAVIVVRDDGNQYDGQRLCGDLLRDGWSEDPAAESAARQQDRATAQASAKADAQESARSAAGKALGALQASNRSFTNAKAVRADVTTADAHLADERQHAKDGNGEDCYNVENVVGYDAENVVGYDVTSTAGYDVAQEQRAVTGLRTQITTLQQALAALTAAGLPTLPGAAAAITTAQANVTTAIATTNGAVDHLNATLATAYRIANTLGTGACASSGPGPAPQGLSHIS
jgi:hypothetical protein